MTNWNLIRKRIIELALNDGRYAAPDNTSVQVAVFEDATVQKFMQPLIHATGVEHAFEMFCEDYNNTIISAINTGILLENCASESSEEKKSVKKSKKKSKKKAKVCHKRVCEDELSAPNSGMAG